MLPNLNFLKYAELSTRATYFKVQDRILFSDIWVTWIRPWRYCGNDLQRVMPFVHSNRRFYIELSDVFWRRKFSLESKGDIESLASYICILTSPDMVEVSFS